MKTHNRKCHQFQFRKPASKRRAAASSARRRNAAVALCCSAAVALLQGSLPRPALAATDTWTGNGTDSNFGTTANWLSGTAPASGDAIVFAAATATAPNNNYTAGTAFDGITFATNAAAFTLSGNSITLSDTAAGNFNGITNSSTSQSQTIDLNLALGWGYYTFSSAAGSSLALNDSLTAYSPTSSPAIEGGVAYFGSNVTSNSFTTDPNTGLIANLNGAAMMMNSSGVFTGLATVNAGAISAYTYADSNAQVLNGTSGQTAITSNAASNVNLTATSATTYTVPSGNVFLNTLRNDSASVKDTITLAGGQVLRFGTVGGIYLSAGGTATTTTNLITIGGTGSLSAGGSTSGTPGELVLAVNGGNASNQLALTLSGGIIDNGAGSVTLVKTGTGSAYINVSSSYSGGTYVDQGYLQANNVSSLGTGPVFVASGTTLYLNAANATFANAFTLSPGVGVSYNPVGAIKIAQANVTLSNTITLQGAAATAAPGDRISENSTGVTATFTGQVTGTGALELYANAAATTFLLKNQTTSASNWNGGLILDGNTNDSTTVKLGAANQTPNGTSAGNVTFAPAGTGVAKLDLSGFNDTVNGLVSASSANVQVTNTGTAATLTVGGGNATAIFGGAISDSGGSNTLSLSKIGTGTQTLNGTNSYIGTTSVGSGVLSVNGSLASGSAVTINGGRLDANGTVNGSVLVNSSGVLGGTGTVAGPVTVSSGGGLIGGVAGTGQLKLNGNLTIGAAGGDVASISVTPNTLSPTTPGILLGSSSAFTLNGNANSVTINVGGAALSIGDYALIGYSGSLGGTGYSAFTLGSLPPRVIANLQNNTGQVDLDVTATDFPVWTGALSSEWSTETLSSPKNWVLNSNNSVTTDYLEGDNVEFTDAATGTTTINISYANVFPTSVIFNNSVKNYTVTGTQAIAGTTGLTKMGSAQVTLGTSNTFSGPVSINGGTLSISSSANLGNAAATNTLALAGGILDFTGTSVDLGTTRTLSIGTGGATVDVEGSGSLALSGIISAAGTDAFTKTGSGTLRLSATNTYTGNTNINSGTVLITNANALGSPTGGTVTIASGAVLDTSALAAALPSPVPARSSTIVRSSMP
jgi:autotransporter-associated beta strand protein